MGQGIWDGDGGRAQESTGERRVKHVLEHIQVLLLSAQ